MRHQGQPSRWKQISQLLTPRHKRILVIAQAFFFVSAMLQVAGAGSIAPFLALLSNPTVVTENESVRALVQSIGLTTELEVLVAFAVGMIVLLAVSNAMAAVSVWITFKLSLAVGRAVQKDLLTYYMHRPFVEIATTNSSDLINKISVGAPRFAFNVLQPALIIASQGAIGVVIFTGLAFFQPVIVLYLGGLVVGGYVLLFLIVRRQLVKHGAIAWSVGQRKLRLLSEGLGGLKEIRVAKREDLYLSAFVRECARGNASEARIGVLGDAPRFLLETIALSSMLVFAIMLLSRGEPPSKVVALLSLYAVTGYRLMPAGQAIFKAVSQIRSNLSVLDELAEDAISGRKLAELARESEAEEPLGPDSLLGTISLRNVTFAYPGANTNVLSDITASIPPRAITAIVGVSGSGKSTLSDIMLGLLTPDSGCVTISGTPIRDLGANWLKGVGYVPQSIFVLDGTLRENIAFGEMGDVSEDRLVSAIGGASLVDVISANPEGLDFQVGERGARLSGGQRQRIGIARALYREASVLVLDEPTSALDSLTESEIIETLVSLKAQRTIVMITHRLSTIASADHILFLDKGILVAEGTHSDLMRNNPAYRTLVANAHTSAS